MLQERHFFEKFSIILSFVGLTHELISKQFEIETKISFDRIPIFSSASLCFYCSAGLSAKVYGRDQFNTTSYNPTG